MSVICDECKDEQLETTLLHEWCDKGCSKIMYVPHWEGTIFFFLISGPIFWKLNYTSCPLFERWPYFISVYKKLHGENKARNILRNGIGYINPDLSVPIRATEILKSKSVRPTNDVIDVIRTWVWQSQIVMKTNDSSFSSKSVSEIDYFSNTL